MISVPYFSELAGKKLWQEIKYNALYRDYLPDYENPNKMPPRVYMFNVSVATVDRWTPRGPARSRCAALGPLQALSDHPCACCRS